MKRGIVCICVLTLTFLAGVFIASPWLVNNRHLIVLSSAPVAAQLEESRLDLRKIFADFAFAESRRLNSWHDPAHGPGGSFPFPEKFEAGHEYVFHRRSPTDTDLLFEALQNRFRSFGLETHLSGAFFGMRLHPSRLAFQGKGFAGYVQITSHARISGNGKLTYLTDLDDYVLAIERAP